MVSCMASILTSRTVRQYFAENKITDTWALVAMPGIMVRVHTKREPKISSTFGAQPP